MEPKWAAEEFGFHQGHTFFSLLFNLQTGPEVHPASYALGTGGSFPERD
jgi:hypothetical protein